MKGGGAYSAGVVAAEGLAVEHVRLARPAGWRDGLERIDAYLQAAGRPRASLCAVALRSPRPLSFEGFRDFNRGYVDVLKSWELFVDGVNPVARTNVAPALDPPAEPCLYSFAYTVPAQGMPVSFVVAGAGELPDGSADPRDIVRAGETSQEAMAVKARYVLGLVEGRMRGLGATWDDVTVTNVYTVHDVGVLLAAEILPRIGRATEHGVCCHRTRPPIVEIEFEMDVRGCAREVVI